MTDDDVRLRQILAATETGNTAVIRLYLSTNPPLEEYSFGPLVRAIAHRQHKIVEMIVDHAGADAFKAAPHAMEIAYRNKDWVLAKYLVEKGAPPKFNNGVAMFHILNDAPLDLIKALIEAEDGVVKLRFKSTLFMLTLARTAGPLMQGRKDLLEWALANTFLPDHTKRQFFISTLEQSPHFLPLLKKHGIYYEDDYDNGTPLLRAIERGYPKAVKALLDMGVDPNNCNPHFPLTIAVALKNEEMVEMLLNAGADVLMSRCGALVYALSHPEEEGILAKLEAAFEAQTRKHLEAYENGDKEDYLLAAKAGRFPDLARDFAEAGKKISSLDLALVKEWSKPYVMAILEVRGELMSLIDHRLFKDPEVDFKLLATMVSCREEFLAAAADEIHKMKANQKLETLRKNKNGGRFKL